MNVVVCIAAMAASLLPPATVQPAPAANPWNGTWTLDATRSSPGASGGAAEAYRFTLRGTSIRWEIPSLAEVVVGHTDGLPMTVRRNGLDSGMTLSVRAEGQAVLRYRLTRRGAYFGGGLMTLVDDGKAWVDVTWGPPGPPNAAQLVYVRKR